VPGPDAGLATSLLADPASRILSRAPEQTAALGEQLAAVLRAGDVLLLSGPIGSGKTVFAKGIARGLGVTETVVSPSFALHAVYEGRLTFNHFDFYRLESSEEAFELAIPEAADGEAVTVIEWGDRFPGLVAPPYLGVRFDQGDADDDRWLTLRPTGEGWRDRSARHGDHG
jgi:tRNA threonylcarbamoyladenosine biosynthesis protein TsaE